MAPSKSKNKMRRTPRKLPDGRAPEKCPHRPPREASPSSNAPAATPPGRPPAPTEPAARPEPRLWCFRKFAADALLSIALGILLGTLVVFVAISRRPEGYVNVAETDPQLLEVYATRFLDNAMTLAETLQADGRAEATFAQEEVTGFLSTMERPGDFPNARLQSQTLSRRIPAKIDNLQIIVRPEVLRIAFRYNEPWLRHPVVSADVRFDIENGRIRPRIATYAGRFPIGSESVRGIVQQLFDDLLGNLNGRYAVESLELNTRQATLTVYRRPANDVEEFSGD